MKNHKAFGIIGKTDSETKLLTDKLENQVYQSHGDLKFISLF